MQVLGIYFCFIWVFGNGNVFMAFLSSSYRETANGQRPKKRDKQIEGKGRRKQMARKKLPPLAAC
jgi:hypothetical protein